MSPNTGIRIASAVVTVAALAWLTYLTDWKVAVAVYLILLGHNLERHDNRDG